MMREKDEFAQQQGMYRTAVLLEGGGNSYENERTTKGPPFQNSKRHSIHINRASQTTSQSFGGSFLLSSRRKAAGNPPHTHSIIQ